MFFFFCKQKTAYEMRISDWSSDVCSSDLAKSWNNRIEKAFSPKGELIRPEILRLGSTCAVDESASGRPSASADCPLKPSVAKISQIGRESCRERVGKEVEIAVVAGALKKRQSEELSE